MPDRKRLTIKDLAALAGVSAVTVHKALYGKKGLAEATREKILALACEHDYTINAAASSLKRRTVRLAVLINEGLGEDRFFYPFFWRGIAEAEEAFKDFNVQIRKYRFSGDYKVQLSMLEKILQERRSDLDGLLTVAWHETALSPVLKEFAAAGIPVVLFNADAGEDCRVGYVGAPVRRLGLLAGELMSSFLASKSRVLVLGGNRLLQNHRETALSFYSELKSRRPDLEVLELYEFYDKEKLARGLQEFLSKFEDIRGLYCVNARNTLTMCEVVRNLGLSGKVKVLGSDVFQELKPYFDDGTLQAVIWQNPSRQAFKAMELLYKFVTKQSFTEKEYVSIGIVMKNNFEFYL